MAAQVKGCEAAVADGEFFASWTDASGSCFNVLVPAGGCHTWVQRRLENSDLEVDVSRFLSRPSKVTCLLCRSVHRADYVSPYFFTLAHARGLQLTFNMCRSCAIVLVLRM